MGKFVIVGGDAAGMSAAMQIVRNVERAEVIVFEMGDTFSYAQCGLPYYLSGEVASSEKLIARKEETFRDKFGIDTRPMHQVTAIDAGNKRVRFTNLLTGETGQTDFDKLLIATGARSIVPKWEGVDLQGVFQLKTLLDANHIKQYLEGNDVRSSVIIGGGYIGLEMAEALSALGKAVTVLDKSKQLALAWDSEISEIVKHHLEENGVSVKLGQTVLGMIGSEGAVAGVRTETETIHADLVLIAVGVTPNSELAKQAGIQLGVRNAIQVNERMETNIPDIYAAGDVAVHYHRIKQKDDYIPLGTTANKQGRIAGKNMSGDSITFGGIVGSAVMKVFRLGAARTGLSTKEAIDLGFDVATATLQTKDHAGYYPNAAPLTVRLIMDRTSKKLLGGQAIGLSGADKRIDVLAVALYHEMTIDQLLELDLSYAPPFNGVWDPIQQAARRF
jgi:NADPH-dependent 2,4-dienoyl-CoA reductase/sulfur reductase-like enzyme